MNNPENLKYTKSHEWVETLSDGAVRVGITEYAQQQMGDIVFVNLPAEGDSITKGGALTDIESVKAVEDIFSPVTGVVRAVNAELEDAPEKINQSPYEAWICELSDVSDGEGLLSAEEYAQVISE